VQPTHLLAIVSQNGVSRAHWLSVRQRTHWPSVRQAGVVALFASHWLEAEQATQTWPPEQIGEAAGH
jgi:transposase